MLRRHPHTAQVFSLRARTFPHRCVTVLALIARDVVNPPQLLRPQAVDITAGTSVAHDMGAADLEGFGMDGNWLRVFAATGLVTLLVTSDPLETLQGPSRHVSRQSSDISRAFSDAWRSSQITG